MWFIVTDRVACCRSVCQPCKNGRTDRDAVWIVDSKWPKESWTRMWANANVMVEYRWRPLFNAAVWLTPTIRGPCSNTAKTRNLLKLPGVPQTNETISAASGPKFTILWGHVEEILLLNKYFPIVDTCLSCEDIARKNCGMVPRWRFLATFLGPAFAASRMQRLSDLHSKFALGPHHVSKYGRHPTCGEEKKKIDRRR